MKKLLLMMFMLIAGTSIAHGAEYTTPSTSNSPSTTYQGDWRDGKFWIYKGKKPSQVITFITVPVTTTGANCTTLKDKVCVVKDVNLVHMVQEVQRLTNELAELQRMPVCTDIDVYVAKIRDLMDDIEKTKTNIDTSETKCDPWKRTENIEFAIINDIVIEKGKTVYKEVYRFRLPQTGASIK